MTPRLQPLRTLLDERVVGHADVKDALLLALLCREHVYLEGPPGAAKTLMAEVLAGGCGRSFFLYQFHRDTRLVDLLGDVVLERRPLENGEGERLRQRIEPGGLLTAELAVLDDLSRAPGEALNVLLRILNERRHGSEPIPLLTAIATGNPAGDDYYVEPLDPANLDRFALQLRVGGLLHAHPGEARELLDHFADAPSGTVEPVRPVVDATLLDELHAALPGVKIPTSMRDALLELLRRLVQDHGLDEQNALLTDRTFLVKVLKLLRGRALLAERIAVEPEDLSVLQWVTTFRVPEVVHAEIPDLIRSL